MVDAAHGGDGWKPRTSSHEEELGTLWKACGVSRECGTLAHVLLRLPGEEMLGVESVEEVLWSAKVDLAAARDQMLELASIYERAGVRVSWITDVENPTPNLVFVRDLFAMTPAGAILSRMASMVRAGEERIIARCLGRMGIPIVSMVTGRGVFEGSDLLMLSPATALLGCGLRTNREGAAQVSNELTRQGIETVEVQTTYGCGHLDGVLNIVDVDKAVVFPHRLSYRAYETLRRCGFTVIDLPDREEAEKGMALNMVPLRPGVVVAPAGCPATRRALEAHGVEVIPADLSALMNAGGAVHCVTGVIHRT